MDHLTHLALGAQRGDREAAEQFVRGASADVWRLCSHFGRVEIVEDLVQETLTRAMAALPAYRGDSNARSWVLAIAWRVCADQGRADRKWDGAVARMGTEPVPHAAIPTGRIELQDLLDRLDADRRAAFVVTQVLGLSYDEAARILGCPVGTIRSRVARARLDLLRLVNRADRGVGLRTTKGRDRAHA